jgi:hypothetical protein
MGLDFDSRGFADAESARLFLQEALESGAGWIDVGNAGRPHVRELLREVRWAAPRVNIIVRANITEPDSARTAAREILAALDIDFAEHFLLPGSIAKDPVVAGELSEDLSASGLVGSVGVWTPNGKCEEYLSHWRDGVGQALSLQADILTLYRLRPYLQAAQSRPVFLRWNFRIPPLSALPAPLRPALEAAGLTLDALALGLPLYTPGVTAVLLPTDRPAETLMHLRGATRLNPDSLLMGTFLDMESYWREDAEQMGERGS